MKQIRMWKVIVLNIVTLGLYDIVWLAKRRNELAQTTKMKLLPNSLLYISMIGVLVAATGLGVLLLFTEKLGFMWVLVGICVFALLMMGLSLLFLFWLWFFLNAAAKYIGPRVGLGWLIAHAIITGFTYVFVLQYYANRKAKPSQTKPSKKFVNGSIALFIVWYLAAFAYGIVIGLMYTPPEVVVQDTPVMQELSKKSQLLYKKYQACAQEINTKYEFVSDETEAAYLKAYDDCEAVRVEQNKAAADYTKLYKEAQTK